MAPVIRISDQTFERLKKLAEPLVDTPSSVIDRLLNEFERGRPLQRAQPESHRVDRPPKVPTNGFETEPTRTGKGALKETFLQSVLLATLGRLGGRSETRDVIRAMREFLRDQKLLAPADLERSNKQNDWERWETNSRFARKHLIEAGMLKADSPHGIWELTPNGRTTATTLADRLLSDA